jgi:hypothetical protein
VCKCKTSITLSLSNFGGDDDSEGDDGFGLVEIEEKIEECLYWSVKVVGRNEPPLNNCSRDISHQMAKQKEASNTHRQTQNQSFVSS